MAKENITINDLAVMVQKGFTAVDKRFDEVDYKFEQVDKRFGQIDKRFDKLEKLILADHKRRIEKLEDELKDIKGTLALVFK
jgi:septal ring factor EnvC (AmiA/AmiB activator)